MNSILVGVNTIMLKLDQINLLKQTVLILIIRYIYYKSDQLYRRAYIRQN